MGPNQPINQPTNQSISQSNNQSINQSINQKFIQSIDQSTNQSSQSINQSTNQSISQSINQSNQIKSINRTPLKLPAYHYFLQIGYKTFKTQYSNFVSSDCSPPYLVFIQASHTALAQFQAS